MTAPSDRLVDLAAGRWTGPLIRRLGLPAPRRLCREPGPWRSDELRGRHAGVAGTAQGAALAVVRHSLLAHGAELDAGDGPLDIAVFDATGCHTVASLQALKDFFGPRLPRLAPCAHLLVLATAPDTLDSAEAAAAAQACEGFVRSLAKEVGRRGATANLLWLTPGSPDRLDGPVGFFCSHRSAYVSGRALRLTATVAAPPAAPTGPPVAVVTGAARGLGAATAERLAEDGTRVLCVDVPAAHAALTALAQRLGGTALALDITAAEAPQQLAAALRPWGGVDLLVHNAGITRDRTLARMSAAEWDAVMAVNLQAVLRLDAALDDANLLRAGGREVCLSSISGIAGNAGQTNYAASKAALIGYVARRATALAERGITVNAVAPGFIETEMTRRIPWLIREAGRRMNALAQGGQPRDVAEAVAFLSRPEALGLTGQVLRVCGQSLLGA